MEDTILNEQEAPARAIEVGSVVRLKSGGEMMTVRDVDASGMATCLFFAASEGLSFSGLGSGGKTLQNYRIPVACLRVA